MALAFDSVLNSTNQNVTSSTNTFAFTNTAGNGMLASIVRRDEGDVITSLTYAGVSMTLLQKLQLPGISTSWLYLFYLNSPATGSNNFVSTSGVTGSDMFCAALTYTGSNTTSSFINTSTTGSSSTGTTTTATVTPTVANCWAVMFTYNDVSNNTASTGSTLRGTTLNPVNYDSNGTITNGSPYSMNATHTSGPWFAVIAAIAPSTVAGTGHSLLMMGVGN